MPEIGFTDYIIIFFAMLQEPKQQHKHHSIKKEQLKSFLVQNANFEKDVKFNVFKDKTTVKLNRKFREREY